MALAQLPTGLLKSKVEIRVKEIEREQKGQQADRQLTRFDWDRASAR
jgi:hypothetical protein